MRCGIIPLVVCVMFQEGKAAGDTERALSPPCSRAARIQIASANHIYLNQGLRGAAMSCSAGKFQEGKKKGTGCYIHPLAKAEKLSKGKQLPLEDEDLL